MSNNGIENDVFSNDWPTKASDMSLAESIIAYYKSAEQGRLVFLDFILPHEGESAIRIKLPLWMTELASALKVVHGEVIYPFVVSQVFNEILNNRLYHSLNDSQARLLKDAITAYFHYPLDNTFGQIKH